MVSLALVEPRFAPGELAPISVDADPNGLAYDPHARSLYIADTRGAIYRLYGEHPRRFAEIDLGGPASRLGGLALTPSGILYVTRLGEAHGAIYRIDLEGRGEPLARPSQRCWRVGLTYDAAAHVLYTTQFLKSNRGCHGGGEVVEVDLVDGYSSTILDGFIKPLGIAKLGAALFVTDAGLHAVIRIDLVGGRAVRRSTLAEGIDRPDSICACGNDSVLVTTFDEATGRGALRRLWIGGGSRILASGAWEPRGVTTDGRRAFVAHRRGGRVLVLSLYEPGS